MKITEAIILAGGLGTRLKSVLPDLPKCMAPVSGKPFLFFLISYFRQRGIEKFILSLGYRHEIIEEYIHQEYGSDGFTFSVEREPLGTGGAIKLACPYAESDDVLVINGDTMFAIDVAKLSSFHHSRKADCSLSLKPMKNFDRYGVVKLNPDSSIESFHEKRSYTEGLINGGVYALNVPSMLIENLPEKFSFEKDYLELLYSRRSMFGVIQDEYFIDIGIPEDYNKAQQELTELSI